MDAELRKYLEALRAGQEALRQEMLSRFQRVESRVEQVENSITEEVAGLRDEVVVAFEGMHKETRREFATLREEIQRGDRETGMLVEAVRDEVRGVADGVLMVREMLERSQEEQNREIDLRRVPLEATVRSHSSQIQDHERRIEALEADSG